MSKRVLLISEYSYPHNTPGAHRCMKLAKYLPRFGWEPVVVSSQAVPGKGLTPYDANLEGEDTCRIIRVPFDEKPLKSLRGGFSFFVLRPAFSLIAPYGLYRGMLKAALQLAREEKPDAIWATSPHLFVLNVARKVHVKTKIPWVADLRDLTDETRPHPDFWCRCRIRQETRVCRSASSVLITSHRLAERLEQRQNRQARVVMNGFDPDDFPEVERHNEFFDIVHAGGIYRQRSPAPLFDALDLIIQRDGPVMPKLRVRFFGCPAHDIEPFSTGRPCAENITVEGQIPLQEMLAVQQRASLLLLLNNGPGIGMLPYKTFEYLAAGRPILSIPEDLGVVDTILNDTCAGYRSGDPARIAEIVAHSYKQWQATGSVEYNGKPERIADYTRIKQAELTAAALDDAIR